MNTLLQNIKKWNKNREYAKLSIFVLIILVILELTIFNCHFYSNLGNTPISITPALEGDIEKISDDMYHFGGSAKALVLRNVDTHVKSLYIDAEIDGEKKSGDSKRIKYVISATDEGNSNYFDLPERAVVYNLENTKYVTLHLNGESENLKINFKDCNNKNVTIKNIVVNPEFPFRFSAVRILVLYIIIALCYILKPGTGFYKYKFNIKSKKQNMAVTAVVVINVAIILALGFAHPSNEINPVSHHHQYHLLAEAMMDGHFYLNEDPDPNLVAMENPYDRHQREEVMKRTGGNYKWDTAYYNGKYYVYFGVVPELLFFLPTRLMGIMIINKAPVMIMCMLAVIFGYLLIRELTRRWFKDTSFLSYMILSVLFVNTTGIFIAIRIPDLYMIPISHALAFSLMGLYCWLMSLPEKGKTELKGVYLFLGSLCMALVAGCRPQVVLASFIAVPVFWKAVFKDRELFSSKSIAKSVLFAAPYVVVAAFLMYYNYARFENIFDFGQNYNLTVMDMVSEKFSFAKIPLGLFTYFIQPPAIIATFPFIKSVEIARNFMGNYVMEAEFGGLIPCNIILLSLFFIPKVKSILKEKKLFISTLLILAIALVITVVDYNTGGIVLRYMIDFMWLIFLSCVIVCYALIEKYTVTPYKKLVYCFIAIGFVWSMAYCFMLLFNINAATYKDNIPVLYYYVQHLIEFWT